MKIAFGQLQKSLLVRLDGTENAISGNDIRADAEGERERYPHQTRGLYR